MIASWYKTSGPALNRAKAAASSADERRLVALVLTRTGAVNFSSADEIVQIKPYFPSCSYVERFPLQTNSIWRTQLQELYGRRSPHSDPFRHVKLSVKHVGVGFLRTAVSQYLCCSWLPPSGYEAFRIALNVHYTSMLLKILPYLAQTLLYSKK